MSAFRILVADDHPVFRFGVCSLLGSHEDWEICGQVADGRDAVEKCRQLKPDLLILDICMPKLNGVDAARQILRNDPAQKILVLTDVRSEQVVRDCLDAGVRGWVFKVDGTDDLIAAVETLQRNRSSFSSRVSDLIMDCYLKRQRVGPAGGQAARLSPREREIVQLVAEGKTSKEVAVILDVAVKTADTHRSNILRKLNLHSIAELVLYAVRNEIVHVQLPAVVRSPNPKLEAHTMPLSAIN
ncbi:MAG TPA: response regulator transcription factor [Terriglobales bacterium]|jgi:DNA-binding NarL/FixJ family response regulator|nr:response regulator transcription factor [Terriglobales bacterium]